MDKRLIENIQSYTNGLKTVQKFKPVTFHKKGSLKKEVGLVAQDIHELEPLVVDKNQNGLMVVDYEKLVCLLLNSIQELSEQINNLKDGKKKK